MTSSDHPGPTRLRCRACGNLTRFDVVARRRTRAYHHFSIGGDLEVEDEEVLDEVIESTTCRWCGAQGSAIEVLAVGATGVAEGTGADQGARSGERSG